MGEIRIPEPVKLVCPMLAARAEWLDTAAEQLRVAFGPTDLESDTWPWEFTDYYADEMGETLLRRIYSFRELVAPERIVDVKRRTNEMEEELSAALEGPPRPVNLDPGYVAASKMVLATTKDFAHRIYLGRGIYAESTLRWRKGRFEPWPWTYSDYKTNDYRSFFTRVRTLYLDRLRRAER